MCNLAVNEVKHYWCCALLCSKIKLQKMQLNVLHVFTSVPLLKRSRMLDYSFLETLIVAIEK